MKSFICACFLLLVLLQVSKGQNTKFIPVSFGCGSMTAVSYRTNDNGFVSFSYKSFDSDADARAHLTKAIESSNVYSDKTILIRGVGSVRRVHLGIPELERINNEEPKAVILYLTNNVFASIFASDYQIALEFEGTKHFSEDFRRPFKWTKLK